MIKELDVVLRDIENELDGIQSHLFGGEALSRYKMLLLDYKCQLLAIDLDRNNEKFKLKVQKEVLLSKIKTLAAIISIISSSFLLCFLIPNTAICGVLGGILLYFYSKKDLKEAEELKCEVNIYTSKMIELINRLQNYAKVLDLKYNKKQENLSITLNSKVDEEKEINMFLLAEYWIEIFLTQDNVEPESIPEDLRPLMVKILQNDLNNDTNDLEVLLHEANAKINAEIIKRELRPKF